MAYGCGDMVPTPLSLVGPGGGSVPLILEGADPDIGGTGSQIINMSSYGTDYVFPGGGSFLIVIENPAPIEVQLANGDNFTISQVVADTYKGDWLPMLIKKVYKSGTSGTFSVNK